MAKLKLSIIIRRCEGDSSAFWADCSGISYGTGYDIGRLVQYLWKKYGDRKMEITIPANI